MSTRSGKRIHVSVDSPTVDSDIILQSQRKTRSKKQKENVQPSPKKRQNYVSYPIDEDLASVGSDIAETHERTKKTGKTRKNTVKHLNLHVSVSDTLDSNNDNNGVRKSCRVKKLIEDTEDAGSSVNIHIYENPELAVNDKKRVMKKKNRKKDSMKTTDMQVLKNHNSNKKSIKKKKELNSIVINNQELDQNGIATDMSVDSFHSTVGSPDDIKFMEDCNKIEISNTSYVERKIEDSICASILKPVDSPSTSKPTVDVILKKKRNYIIKNSSFSEIEVKDPNNVKLSLSFDKMSDIATASTALVGLTTEKKIKSNNKNSPFNKIIPKDANEDNLDDFDKTTDIFTVDTTTLDVSLRKSRKSIKNSTIDSIAINDLDKNNLNTTFDDIVDNSTTFNSTVDVSTRKRKKSSLKNSTFVKIGPNKTNLAVEDYIDSTLGNTVAIGSLENGNLTETNDKHNASVKLILDQVADNSNASYDNDTVNCKEKLSSSIKSKSSVMNSTFNKLEIVLGNNEIKDKRDKLEKDSSSVVISPLDIKYLYTNKPSMFNESNEIPNDYDRILNSTFEGASNDRTTTNNLDSMFNKDINIEVDTTFDTQRKSDILVDTKRLLLIHSDATINVTFDKSRDNSRISVTSDESKTKNIFNHTPFLIESSIDESMLQHMSPVKSGVPVTPLRREGTFTKEVSDVNKTPNSKASAENISAKCKSSPGCTPLPYSKSSHKENTKLNVTRSIEKSLRSSVVEVEPKQTRVMFCSPANNPGPASQMKGRVIKSNLKGSNKSFIFEDSVFSGARNGGRKRSLTVCTVGDAESRTKRKRLGDELQDSVNRLSRPRTHSAAAKFPDPGTPSKKYGTPSKAKPESKVSRTKLPNFAALHQKQFAKMESLDECQERKAKRAKQLLTPTGSLVQLERISPKGTPPKPAPPTKESTTKLNTTPSTTKPKLLTLESLNPGYTRFGFKLNMGVNPFTVTRKTEARNATRPTDSSRQTTCSALPSLAGTTANRMAAAKQAVMREKSFTEKRNVSRKETRTVIKGVRTNRRFELQMKMRDINA